MTWQEERDALESAERRLRWLDWIERLAPWGTDFGPDYKSKIPHVIDELYKAFDGLEGPVNTVATVGHYPGPVSGFVWIRVDPRTVYQLIPREYFDKIPEDIRENFSPIE